MSHRDVWSRALVTGASSGIGEAFARLLAVAGVDLVVVARSGDRLRSLADELCADYGVAVEVLVADLADPVQLGTVEARISSDERPVDLVVNSAGFGYHGDLGVRDVDDEVMAIEVNVVALMRLSHAAARAMPARSGAVINVASIAGFQPAPGFANYAATKAYVLSLSQALHEELRPKGVTVTALCPGYTRTGFQAVGGWALRLPGFAWQQPDEVARAGLEGCARGRAVVVTGWLNRVVVATVQFLPMSVQRLAASQVLSRLNRGTSTSGSRGS